MNGLHADSIRKAFAGKQILNDVFISCASGEVVGLLGRNGSGKSTLLKIIFGALAADYKYVLAAGKRITSLYDSKGFISYLPQDSYLPVHVRLEKIIDSFCLKNEARRLKDNVYIEPFLKRKAQDLSGGEKRIIETLLIIYSGAKYLLLDEPFNGLSPLYIEQMKEIIRQHPDKGFIITDHDYCNVLDLATKVVLMQHGNTRIIEHPSQLIDFGYLPEIMRNEWSAYE